MTLVVCAVSPNLKVNIDLGELQADIAEVMTEDYKNTNVMIPKTDKGRKTMYYYYFHYYNKFWVHPKYTNVCLARYTQYFPPPPRPL